jgi:8-oxo-dGTP pyrophosphatase MutT (NUDIX family)
MTASPPVHRVTARVLPVAPDGAVLLLRELDPARPERPYWSSIGGRVDDGETLAAAAVRELHEETGVSATPGALVGPVVVHENAYTWDGVHYAGEHAYFALPLARATEVRFDHLEPEEVGTVLDAAWLTPDDVAAREHEPPGLPDIMRAAVAAVAQPDESRGGA